MKTTPASCTSSDSASANLREVEKLLPSTRYVGSKRKLVGWIWQHIGHLGFDNFLEIFGGTGSLSYYAKMRGKEVTYNDFLKFNYYSGLALIENSVKKLSEDEIQSIVTRHQGRTYPDFIERNFSGLYFTDIENRWLDMALTNIRFLQDPYEQALAMHALFQSCTMKRPYNLFHRANLYMRLANVKRGFGNLVSWNTDFESVFRRFTDEANEHVFSNGRNNKALNMNAMDLEGDFDLVYIDSPYMSAAGAIDYREYYHFLEGMSRYDEWKTLIDYDTKRKTLKADYSMWLDKPHIERAFDHLFDKFRNSSLVVSYKTGGIPSSISLKRLLRNYKSNVTLHKRYYRYALAKTAGWELLFVAR